MNIPPGPGTYKTFQDQFGGGWMGDAPAFTMSARKRQPKVDDASPGPIYSPRTLTHEGVGPMGDAPQFSFGNSTRFASGEGIVPGPGKYPQVTTRNGSGMMGDAAKYSFGTSPQREPYNGKDVRGKRFISKEHAEKSNFGLNSPGQIYTRNDELGTYLAGKTMAMSFYANSAARP